MMDSHTSYSNHDEYTQYRDKNNESSSRLLRFRSAPESLFANLTDGTEKSTSSSDEKGNNFIVSSQNGYGSLNSQLPPQYPRHSSSTGGQLASAVDGGFNMFLGSSLMRQNSSPPGLFSHLNSSQNDYSAIRGIGGNGDFSQSSSSVKNEMNNYHSDFKILSRISEAENRDETPSNEKRDDQPPLFYSNSRFPFGSSWNHSPSNFVSGLKKESAELRNEGGPPMLSHHLSLPTSSAEMAEIEKLLHFQDTVPCKLRAKRGFATHPRSIAERVRRTRISERMRKLQNLVPNMDKQTNTADMLDFAVDYIKDLREQYKILTNIRAKCKCSPLGKQVSSQTS